MRSARFRITAVATLVVALVLAVAAVFSVRSQRNALTDVIDDRIEQQGDDIATQLADGTIPDPLAREYDDDGFAQLVDERGDVVAASPNLDDAPAIGQFPSEGPQRQWSTVDDTPFGDAEFRLLARRVETPDGQFGLYVGGELDDVNESVAVLQRNLALAFPLVLLLVAGIIWLVVDRALRRVEAANERQRRFLADASHELRSPLTGIRSELEVDLAHPERRDLAATHRTVLEETVRLQRLVDDLLFLARSDAGAATPRRAPVDLDGIVLEEASAVRGRRRIDVDAGGVSGAQVVGDGDQLGRAVRNLLDNAERHARSRVTVTLAERDGEVVLTVADDGPGIAPDQVGRVFERFGRADEARAREHGGSGLGLAITHDIVRQHRGTITVDENGAAGGARFVIRLPGDGAKPRS